MATHANAFRSIRNTGRSDGRPAIRPIKNSFGISGTEYWSIRYESSAYRERLVGLSGTAYPRDRRLGANLRLLTGGLTFLTPLTSLTNLYDPFQFCLPELNRFLFGR